MVKEAVKLAAHAGRKTLKDEDIEMAAEKMA
ncbi:MAG: NFYB/HAP3 family transcription factor subunit [Methanospirillum sp.]|nr:NFYB/HAP3 family transcription factor subunit [Methanospirillum sp.]